MIVQEHFLKKLRSAFDLNIYEVKIWTALLSRGVATAGELSDISNVPRSRSYDVLESLEKKGFVLMKIGKPIKYIAVKPEEVVKRVKGGIKRIAGVKIDNLDRVKQEKVFTDLELLFNQGIEKIDPMSLSGAIKGRKNIYDQLDSMLQNAEISVLIASSAEGAVRKLEAFKSRFKKLINKGVRIKVAAPVTDDVKEAVKGLKIQVKDIKLNSRFIVVDGREIMFMIADDKKIHENYDSAVWVNTPFFAKSMEHMFNVNWR